MVAEKNNTVVGVMLAVLITEHHPLLKRLSTRCVVYGGPLLLEDNPEVLRLMLNQLNKSVSRKAIFTQFRNFRVWVSDLKKVFEQSGFQYRERLNLITPTPERAKLLAGISKSRLRQIRKAQAAGVTIRPVTTLSEVHELYLLLRFLYREKVRKPLPSEAFFTAFFDHLTRSGEGIMWMVEAENKMIGGIVCPISKGKSVSELYVCGLDKQYPHYHPSIMATWAALSFAADQGIDHFDFMGLGRPDRPYGVRDFKLRFGGNIVNYGRFARRNQKTLYWLAEIGYNVLRIFHKI